MKHFLLACLTLFAASASQAATVYLTFGGGGASGDIDGVAFADAAWSLEYAIETSTPDATAADSSSGLFLGAVTSGILAVNGTPYRLIGQLAGLLDMVDTADTEFVIVNPTPGAGQFVQFAVGNGGLFPPLFRDVNNLGSAALGTTVRDDSLDSFANSSVLSLMASVACGPVECEVVPGAQYEGGSLSIFAAAAAGSNTWTLGVSSASTLAPIPLPAAAGLLISGLAALGAVVRRKRSPYPAGFPSANLDDVVLA